MARISQPGAGAPAETADDQSAPEARVDMPSEQPEVQAASSDADAAQTGGAAGGAADAAASDSPHEDAPSAEQQNEELEEEDEGQHGEDAEDEAEAGVEEQPAGGESGDAAARAGQAAGDSCDSAEQQREADEPAEAVAEEGEGDAAGEQDGDAADEDEAEEEEAEAEGAEEEAQPAASASAAAAVATRASAGSSRRTNKLTFTGPPKCLERRPRLAARANYSHSQARVRQILRDNEALVRRLGEIAYKPPEHERSQQKHDQFMANVAASATKRRATEAGKVMKQNLRIYQRLQAVKPSRDVARAQHEKDFEKHERMLATLAALKKKGCGGWVK